MGSTKNVKANLIAKAYWKEMKGRTLQPWQQDILGKGWTLWIDDHKIRLRFKEMLYEHIHHPKILEIGRNMA